MALIDETAPCYGWKDFRICSHVSHCRNGNACLQSMLQSTLGRHSSLCSRSMCLESVWKCDVYEWPNLIDGNGWETDGEKAARFLFSSYDRKRDYKGTESLKGHDKMLKLMDIYPQFRFVSCFNPRKDGPTISSCQPPQDSWQTSHVQGPGGVEKTQLLGKNITQRPWDHWDGDVLIADHGSSCYFRDHRGGQKSSRNGSTLTMPGLPLNPFVASAVLRNCVCGTCNTSTAYRKRSIWGRFLSIHLKKIDGT